MLAFKARFDGKRIVLPDEARSAPAGDVIVVFTAAKDASEEAVLWERAQEAAFAAVWDNPADAVYDEL